MDGVDLSNLQQIDFGGDTGFYDPSSGKYYDSGGNALSSAELAQYGSFTVTGLGSAAPSQPSPSGAVTGSGSGAALAGLSGLFSTIGNAIVNATRSPTVRTPTGGTLVYNPQTGGYTTTAALNSQAMISPLLLLLLAGGVVWFVMREERR
jgi:hypothetical protein